VRGSEYEYGRREGSHYCIASREEAHETCKKEVNLFSRDTVVKAVLQKMV
jgi:hypothetical protein